MEWIWQDDERVNGWCGNTTTNSTMFGLRTFSGDHLTLPGASKVVTLHPHQKSGRLANPCKRPTPFLGLVVGAARHTRWFAAGMD